MHKCEMNSIILETLNAPVPPYESVKDNPYRLKAARALEMRQKNILASVLACKLRMTDKITPITNRQFIALKLSKTDPEGAKEIQQMTAEELTVQFAEYCLHPTRIANGSTNFYGLLLWEMMKAHPNERFVDAADPTVFACVPAFLNSLHKRRAS